MSFSLAFLIYSFLSLLSCLFCSTILIETKDQTSENILIAIQRNLSIWLRIPISKKKFNPYLELSDETNHSQDDRIELSSI